MYEKTFIFFALLYSNIALSQASFPELLQKYWNYRYHLIGDRTIKTPQFMPWESDYRYNLGEGGMMAIGPASGNSIPATKIQLYNVPENGYTTVSEPGVSNWQYVNLSQLVTPFKSATVDPEAEKSCYNQILDNGSILENLGGIVVFDDQVPNVLAEYIMVLSTEWKLLNNNGYSTIQTEYELNYALDAINRMDEFSSVIYSNSEPTSPNGLFYRDDVPWDMALGDNFGPNELISSAAACDYYKDNCTDGGVYNPNANLMMSTDNAIYVLSSLAWVTEMLENSGDAAAIRVKAQEIAKRICYYIRDGNVPDPWNQTNGDWRLQYPSGNPVCKGSLAIFWSYLIPKATKRITESPYDGAYQNSSSWIGKFVWQWGFRPLAYAANPSTPYTSDGNAFNFAMATDLAIAADLWKTRYGPGHVGMKLYRKAGEDVRGEPNIHFDLMSSVLNGLPSYKNRHFYEDILTDETHFPCYSTPIWNEGSWSVEANNELGFMLLFNLYCLKWPETYLNLQDNNFASYSDLKSRTVSSNLPVSIGTSGLGYTSVGSATYPVEIQAAEQLEVSAHLSNTAHVNFFAPHITLQPGFLAETGSISLIQNARMECNPQEFPLGNTLTQISATKTELEEEDNAAEEEIDPEELPANMQELLNSGILEYFDSTERFELISYWTDYFTSHGEKPTEAVMKTIQDQNEHSYSMIAYPNPFSSTCTVSIRIEEPQNVTLSVTDLMGHVVFQLCNNNPLNKGLYEYKIEKENLSAGLYILRYSDLNNNLITQSLSIK